jgi:hypothetical protein
VIPADLLMHRSPEKWRALSATAPLVWSEGLGCWTTANPDVLLSILKDDSFEVVDFRAETARLAEGLGVDLHATKAVFDHLPLALEGAEHSSKRRIAAQAIKQNSSAALEKFAEALERLVKAPFDRGEPFNIVSEIFAPAIEGLVSTLSGLRVESEEGDPSPSQIFDRMLSVNRRKLIDRRLDAAIRSHGAGCPIDDVTLKAAISVVGTDSLVGSVTESFIHEVERNDGKRLSEFAWSDRLPRTGVPYVDRIATKPISIAGSQVEPGQRIRLFLVALQLLGADGIDGYFGAGRHLCLGKAVSIRAWHILTAELGKIEKRVRITEIGYRKSDFVFNTPANVEVVVENE